MKTKVLSLILLIICAFAETNAKGLETADDILSMIDKTIFTVKDKTADIEMVMIDMKSKKQKIKKAILMQKGPDKKLFKYTYPKNDKGISTLSLPNGDIYLYLPLFKKPKKITNMAEGNTFNSSDFSIQDMTLRPYAEEYTPKLVETTDNSYVLDLKPKSDEMEYSHLTITVNKSHYYRERIEYFDKRGHRVKEAAYKYEKTGIYWIADHVTMTDLKKQHKTKLIMTNIRINQGLKDDLFTPENMITPK